MFQFWYLLEKPDNIIHTTSYYQQHQHWLTWKASFEEQFIY